MIGNTVEKTVEKVMDHTYKAASDYIGEDGLLYCGMCKTRKERRITWLGTERKVPVMCKCREEEYEAQQEEDRKKQEAYDIQRARVRSMLSDNFKTATFENYKVRKESERYLRIAQNYCTNFRKMLENNQGLLLYGTVGTGKSYTAACIANYLLDHGYSVIMTSFVRILQQMQRFDKETEDAFICRLNSVSLLIIDDLGAERSTDYALEKVYGVIDNRYLAKKPLILTTNLDLGQMQAVSDLRYERIYDRVFEMCYPVEFTGISWRKREAAQRFESTRKLLEE